MGHKLHCYHAMLLNKHGVSSRLRLLPVFTISYTLDPDAASWFCGAPPVTDHIVSHGKLVSCEQQSLAGWTARVYFRLNRLEQDHRGRAMAFGFKKCVVPDICNAWQRTAGPPNEILNPYQK